MPLPDGIKRNVIDGHSHIGEIEAWPFYGIDHPVKPIVYDFPRTKDFLKFMDQYGIERSLVMSNYGIPEARAALLAQPDRDGGGDLAPTASAACCGCRSCPATASTRSSRSSTAARPGIVGPQDDLPPGRQPEPGGVGRGDQGDRRPLLRRGREARLRLPLPHVGRRQQRHQQLHPDGRGRTGSACKIHLVHFGGGVSGHIKLVPKFLQWVKDGYKVYTDTSWAIGFGARWLLVEIEKQGIGGDRVHLRLRRALVGLHGRVLEDRGRAGLRGAQADGVRGELREAARASLVSAASPPDLQTLAVELQSLGVRTRAPTRARAPPAPAAPGPRTPASSGSTARRSPCRCTATTWPRSPYELVMNGSRPGGHAAARRRRGRAGAPAPAPEDLRPRDGRRRAVLEDRPDAPGQPGLHGLPALRLLGHRRAVPLLRHRHQPGQRPHDPGQDAGAPRRGGRGRRAPRRRQGRHPHHRHAQPRTTAGRPTWRAAPRPSASRAGCRCRCRSSRRTTSPGSPSCKDSGVEALGLHLEVWDQEVLARVAPGKHAQGRDHYLAAWEAAVEVFGPGQVSTYFILGLGETPGVGAWRAAARPSSAASTRSSCRCAPRRGASWPTACRPPPSTCARSTSWWRRCWPRRGMMSQNARAGCVRCQACSALSTFERAFGGGRERRWPRAGAAPMSLRPDVVRVRLARTEEDLAAHHRVRHAVFVRGAGHLRGRRPRRVGRRAR